MAILRQAKLSGEEKQKLELNKSQNRKFWKSGVVEKNIYDMACMSPAANPNLIDCKGITEKGETIRVDCEEGRWFGTEIGACTVSHSSLEEGYHAYYEFAMDLLPHWRRIDVAIFNKMKSWEQK